ncbi:MAG: S8 family serine peptidase [Phycisphaerae bacterium]|nr:S8 family serine peptidase [Phycisphaerae bacterium]
MAGSSRWFVALFVLAGAASGVSVGNDGKGGLGSTGPKGDWLRDWYDTRNAIIESTPELVYDPTSLMVRFTPDSGEAEREVIRTLLGARVIETYDLVPGLEHLTSTLDVQTAIDLASGVGGAAGVVEFAEVDFILRADLTPNDTYYSLEWGLNNTGQTVAGDPGTNNCDIDAPAAWDLTTGSSAVVIGCIDTGIRKTHEDLSANIWTNPGDSTVNGVDNDGNGYRDDTWGWNFYANTNNPNDDNGHGSHTAGTVGAQGNNGKGVAGVAWNCKLAALKFLGSTGSGSTSGAIAAINYCVGKGIKVSNNSWGGPGSSSLSTAISNARAAGHLLVVAAGNSGVNIDTSPTYPASYTYDNIISVAAVNNDFGRASFSNYGASSVDLGAPGVMVASCYNSSNSAYVYMDGTSMATPHVTGVAALVWSRYPSWTYAQVRSRILSTVRPAASLSGKCTTGGVLNAANAVQ